ncbi:hypothetical protein SBOR_7171 [Sclerotinia borealis F-4128]|uniref:FAD-binding domain-containing protein n=1 Tax=Sclerotinia borealis (strain F-4128) TaxID=1432307 RepID=W9CC96_SCLBF|nr:hypothetical protein SBOR_7171 [Sclerotinia borealis F-4128]
MTSEITTSGDLAAGDKKSKLKVLIVGAGIVGLTLAQGCRENGIEFEIVERDESGKRAQGWAITLHVSWFGLVWCGVVLGKEKEKGYWGVVFKKFGKNDWGEIIGVDTYGKSFLAGVKSCGIVLKLKRRRNISEFTNESCTAAVDPALNDDDGNFLFLNARTVEARYKIPPSKLRRRLDRQKIRNLLATDLFIQEGKGLTSFTASTDFDSQFVTAHFSDHSESRATLIVGADGNNSVTRRCLYQGTGTSELTKLPVYCVGIVRPFTEAQIAAVRDIDPLLFQGLDPETGTYMWFSLQGIIPNADGSNSYTGLVVISWLIKDEIKDTMPRTDRERVLYVKRRAEGYAEPLRSIVQDIPEDITTTPLRLSDWPCQEWDNWGGRVTLVGDAAHAMTMYRGEGANHGILDAALLVDQLKKVQAGKITQKEAIDAYEAEMRPRTHEAVLKSRQAALDAHDWDGLTENSPVIGGRFAPKTAFI